MGCRTSLRKAEHLNHFVEANGFNLKLGRRGKTNSLILSRSGFSWRLGEDYNGKCRSSKRKANFLNFRHLARTGRTSSMEGLFSHTS